MYFYCLYVGLFDRWHLRKTGFPTLPPAPLRYRVHGSPKIEGFLTVGKTCRDDIESTLEQIGKPLTDFSQVLDFGCGCGRTMMWVKEHAQNVRFFGTDTDAEAVAWCQACLPFAEFRVNDPLSKLAYPDDQFDLIYGVSVFTQLDEAYQFYWLEELRRVVKPGGVVLLTVLGEHCWQTLNPEDQEHLRETGFLFRVTNRMKGIFPEWYQTAYHSQDYVVREFSVYFKVLAYIPRGLSDFQDMVVLQKGGLVST